MRIGLTPLALIVALCGPVAASTAEAARPVHRSTAQAKAQPKAGAPAVIKTVGDQLTFDPPRLVIRRGQTVQWQNQSRQVHNIVDDPAKVTNKADVSAPASAPVFDSGFLNPGQNYSHRFTVRGTYRYVCTLHEPQGMKGEIVVK
jgi:plastocyanin